MPVSSTTLPRRTFNERVSSGNNALDTILGGGYFRGSCVLLAGASGSGKTTVASTFTQQTCADGENVLFVHFEESQEALVAHMKGVGMDFGPLLKSGKLRILTAMPESRGTEEHLLRILTVMDRFQPRHLVVDAISACQRMRSKRSAFDFLVRLLTACTERGITCFYINQIGDSADLMEISGAGISSLVETLVSLQYVAEEHTISRRILVLKSRGGPRQRCYHHSPSARTQSRR